MDCPGNEFSVLKSDGAGGFTVDHARIRGANYFSIGTNPLVFWTMYEAARIEQELDVAVSVGLNSLRVWLSYEAYLLAPALHLSRIDHFLAACCERRIVLLVVTADFAFGWNGTGAVESWSGTPGVRLMADPDRHAEFLAYIDQAFARFDEFPNHLVMIDLVNEPGSNPWLPKPTHDAPSLAPPFREAIVQFLLSLFERVRALAPTRELTVGQGITGAFMDPRFLAAYPLTFQSLHGGYNDVDALRDLMEVASSAPVPSVLTETAASPDLIPYAVRFSEELGVGFMFWGLLKGFNEWNSWTGLFHHDGTVTSATAAESLSGVTSGRFVEKPHSSMAFESFDPPVQIGKTFDRLLSSFPVTAANVDEMWSFPWHLLFWGEYKKPRAPQIPTHQALLALHVQIQMAFVAKDDRTAYALVEEMVTVAATMPRGRPGLDLPGTIHQESG